MAVMSELDGSMLKKTELTQTDFLDNLPDELLLEILRRLLPDLRSAIRCIAVSKRWHSLVSNHYSQYLDSKPYTLLFQFTNRKKLTKLNKNKKMNNFSSEFETYRVFCEESKSLHTSLGDSCNYLSFLPVIEPFVRASFEYLLLVSSSSCLVKQFYICNPLTRTYFALPHLALEKRLSRLGLICKTNVEENNYIYRVVHITDRSQYQLVVYIFCSETRNWSQFSVKSPKPLHYHFGFSRTVGVVACNGMLHWVDGYECVRGIVAFNPFDDSSDRKQCFYIDPPKEELRNVCLGSCKGRLQLSHFVPTDECHCLTVWELMDYGDNSVHSWCLKHRVCFERMEKFPAVLAFHPNNDDVIFFFYDSRIIQYDLHLSKKKKVDKFPVEIRKLCSPEFNVFPLLHPFWPTKVPALPSI